MSKESSEPCSNKILALLRGIDMYGHPITLTYKNQATYKTALGGVFTIISRCLLLSYFLYQVVNIINHESTITTTTHKNNITMDPTKYAFNSSNFDFAVKM